MNKSPEGLVWLKEVDSTNRFAQSLVESGKATHGTAIMADYQTAGKGQKGNKWESEPGKNMLATFIFFPAFLKTQNLFIINQLVCVSICDILEQYTQEPFSIKWPNDILFGERKIAGVLVENSLRGSVVQHSIIGVGINLNQITFNEYEPKAVSLFTISGNEVSRIDEFTIKLRNSISSYFQLLEVNPGKQNEITKAYMIRLFGLNQKRKFVYDGKLSDGTIEGVDDNGQLIMELEGRKIVLGPKEVRFVFDQNH